MLSDFTAVIVVILFTIIAFVSAAKHGVVKMLASGCAAAIALAVFFFAFNYLREVPSDSFGLDLSLTMIICAFVGISVVVYLISLIIFIFLFKALLGPDSPLHPLVDGIPGGILSLFPSAVVAVFIFTCVRVAGTVQELNYTASLSQENIESLTRRIPPYPFTSNWRNGIEDIPLLAPLLDLVDPFGNRVNRNASALVMMQGSGRLRSYLLSQPETEKLAQMQEFIALRREIDIRKALDKQSRLGLVLDPTLQATAAENEHIEELRELDLKRILVGFGRTLQPDEPNLQ